MPTTVVEPQPRSGPGWDSRCAPLKIFGQPVAESRDVENEEISHRWLTVSWSLSLKLFVEVYEERLVKADYPARHEVRRSRSSISAARVMTRLRSSTGRSSSERSSPDRTAESRSSGDMRSISSGVITRRSTMLPSYRSPYDKQSASLQCCCLMPLWVTHSARLNFVSAPNVDGHVFWWRLARSSLADANAAKLC